jgi:hypothetical protein
MSAQLLVHDLKEHGVVLETEGPRLIVDAPVGVLTTDIIDQLKANKPDLLALLGNSLNTEDWRAAFEERAAIMEYDGGMPRHDAENLAFDDAVVRWMREHPPISRSGLCVGCGEAIGNSASCDIAILGGSGGLIVHDGCYEPFMSAWQAEAEEALVRMGISPPDRSSRRDRKIP